MAAHKTELLDIYSIKNSLNFVACISYV